MLADPRLGDRFQTRLRRIDEAHQIDFFVTVGDDEPLVVCGARGQILDCLAGLQLRLERRCERRSACGIEVEYLAKLEGREEALREGCGERGERTFELDPEALAGRAANQHLLRSGRKEYGPTLAEIYAGIALLDGPPAEAEG